MMLYFALCCMLYALRTLTTMTAAGLPQGTHDGSYAALACGSPPATAYQLELRIKLPAVRTAGTLRACVRTQAY